MFCRMGLLDEEELVKRSTPLDTLTHYLANKLAFRKYKCSIFQ